MTVLVSPTPNAGVDDGPAIASCTGCTQCSARRSWPTRIRTPRPAKAA